jgi:hypothetical protein
MRTALLLLVWVSGSILIGWFAAWRWTRTGLSRKYPGEEEARCACPLAADAERILEDGRFCPYPVDGADGLCGMCRFLCLPLVKELRQGIRRG